MGESPIQRQRRTRPVQKTNPTEPCLIPNTAFREGYPESLPTWLETENDEDLRLGFGHLRSGAVNPVSVSIPVKRQIVSKMLKKNADNLDDLPAVLR